LASYLQQANYAALFPKRLNQFLVYLDEFSAPEIAVVLERPVNNLCVRLPRAMIQLKGILNDETHCA
jgi:DNA-directed RNA polymerase specialized sigma24 family protein